MGTSRKPIRLGRVTYLAIELARTVRHDGRDGVTDLLDTPDGYADWIDNLFQIRYENTDRERVITLRRAIRALFAQAVYPDPPGKPDDRDLAAEVALAEVNTAAGAVLRAPQLDWPSTLRHNTTAADPTTQLLAELARSAIDLLTCDDRKRLRACPAPRCVRYFLQDHPRQAWCKPSCGNRARVSRYYQRHHEDSSTGSDSMP
jgi:predicted RNA-binding Zn ribbon-like protein